MTHLKGTSRSLPNTTSASPHTQPSKAAWTGKLTDVIHRHFGEPPPACSSMCDICTVSVKRAALEDCTAAAQAMLAVLEAAFKAKKHATLVQLLDAWQKSKVRSSIRPGFLAHRLAPLCAFHLNMSHLQLSQSSSFVCCASHLHASAWQSLGSWQM